MISSFLCKSIHYSLKNVKNNQNLFFQFPEQELCKFIPFWCLFHNYIFGCFTLNFQFPEQELCKFIHYYSLFRKKILRIIKTFFFSFRKKNCASLFLFDVCSVIIFVPETESHYFIKKAKVCFWDKLHKWINLHRFCPGNLQS